MQKTWKIKYSYAMIYNTIQMSSFIENNHLCYLE